MIEAQQELEEKAEILVVDDDVNTRKILKLIFSKENWNTETVGTGSEALERIKEKYFNIILLDIRLPDMKGIDIISPMKKAFPDTIIMMMTAYASKETAVQALNMGATAYITKPFNMEDVLSKIRETFEKQLLALEKERLYNQLQQELKDRKIAEEKIEHLNTILRAVRNVNRLITKEKDRGRLIGGACATLVESRGFFWTWIALFDKAGIFSAASECGLGDAFSHVMEHLKDNELPHCCQKSLQSDFVVVIDDCPPSCHNYTSSCLDRPLRTDNGFHMIATRLIYDQKVYGVLCASVSTEFIREEEELSIFKEVADDIAFALHDTEIVEERDRMAEALQLNEEKLRKITETSPDFIMMLDLECRIQFLNRPEEGVRLEDLIGTPLYTLVDEEESHRVKKVLMEVINSKMSKNYETMYERPDGTIIYYESLAVPMESEGTVVGIIVNSRDVTERKIAEINLTRAKEALTKKVTLATRDLVEEKQLVETVVETIPDGIIVIDFSGKIELVNKVFKDYFERIYSTDLPTYLRDLSLLENQFGDTISKLFYSQKEETITIEPIKGLFLQLVSSRLVIPPNTYLGVIIAVHDVSPFIELDNLRKQFVSVVSHELRTPITAINLSLRNLQRFKGRISEDQQNAIIDMTVDSAMVLTQMIEDLLIASRIEAGKIILHWKRYKISDVIQSVLNVLEPRRVGKSIGIQVDVNPELTLYGDEKRINQIFRILVDNAIKYSKKNTEILIRAENDYSGDYNPRNLNGTLIQVIDSGLGISNDDLPFIFERFFRSKHVSDKRGSGLGLSIAREMVNLHHGEIFLESEFKKGSTFSVFLPRMEKQNALSK